MRLTVAICSTFFRLLSSLYLFPVHISGIHRFDMDHVVSFRHGHNAGAPAQMRIMKPSITAARYKKLSANFEGPELYSIIQQAPVNMPDEEHELIKRDVASTKPEEKRKDPLPKKKVSDDIGKRGAPNNKNDQHSPGKGKLPPDLSSVPSKVSLKKFPSAKHIVPKEALAHHQDTVLVFKTGASSEEDGGGEKESAEYPVPGFVEAPTK